jgi:pyochelin biosynthetic protein PchC
VVRPRLRLVCFPHAGAGPTAYRAWAELLPPGVELLSVSYPGHQDRLGEPFAASVGELAGTVARELAPLASAPLALFGHSMGALLAYEVTVRLEARHGIVPRHLFVSGRQAPDWVDHRTLHLAADEELIDEIRTLGNRDLEVLAHPELRKLVLPVLRADYGLLAAHRRDRIDPVAAPVTVYSGDRDPVCPVTELGAWSRVTTGGFALKVYPGDHFYLVPLAGQLVGDLLARLAATVSV